MNRRFCLLTNFRMTALVAMTLALFMKAVLPAGVMLERDTETRFITAQLCTGTASARTITIDVGSTPDRSEPAPPMDEGVCAFALASASSATIEPPARFEAVWQAADIPAGDSRTALAGIRLPAANPPTTGPPATDLI